MRGPAFWREGAIIARAGGGLALLAGFLQTTAFAPLDAWYLQLLALALLAVSVWEQRPRAAAVRGLLFGAGWLGSGLWWLYISLHDHGHLPAVLSVGVVLLLALLLSLYCAGAMAVFARLRSDSAAWRVALFAGLWLLAELARASWLTGFPWIASGYAHSVGPLAVLAPWVGVYGITLLAGGISASLIAATRRQFLPLLACLLMLGAAQLLPREFTRSTGSLAVSLVQPNVPQEQKFDPDLWARNLDALLNQTERARGQVVITPESVVPLPLVSLEPQALARMTAIGRRRPLLVGSFLGNEREGYVNSLVAFDAGSRWDTTLNDAGYSYGKRHLLPFGEFVPWGFHWFVDLLRIPMDDQARGAHQRAYAVAGQHIRPLICYEDLFGEDFVQSLVGPEQATVLANASNLAWFGPLMVQDQHLQFSQMRTLEFQRPLVRSTNTGATAALDHHGRLIGRLPPEQSGVLELQIEGRTGSTPYARWLALLGLAPLWAAGLVLVLAGARWRRG